MPGSASLGLRRALTVACYGFFGSALAFAAPSPVASHAQRPDQPGIRSAGAATAPRVRLRVPRSPVRAVLGRSGQLGTRLAALPPETPEERPATAVTATGATLNGVLHPGAGGEAGTYFFEYRAGSECAGGQSTPIAADAGHQAEPAVASITALSPATSYSYCLVSVNGAEESSTGPAETFTTPATSPTVDEQAETDVSATGATVRAAINPGGAWTSYRFEYRVAGGAYAPAPDGQGFAGQGTQDVVVTAHVPSLTPATQYEVRILVTSALGSTEGTSSFTTETAGSGFGMLDGRQWELVSPQEKDGSAVNPVRYAGGVVQAAEDGSAIAYTASGPFAEPHPEGNVAPGAAQVLSTRAAPGSWRSRDLTTPHNVGAVPVGDGFEYKSFSGDLTSAVLEPLGESLLPAPSVRTPQEQTIYLRDGATAKYQPLANEANVIPGARFGSVTHGNREHIGFQYATSDLRHVVFLSNNRLTSEEPGVEPAATPGGANLYEWSGAPGELGTVRLISALPAGELASENGVGVGDPRQNLLRDAVSADGSRIIWTGGGAIGGRPGLNVTDTERHETLRIDLAENPAKTNPLFQGANPDGTKIFFLDPFALVPGADETESIVGRGDLYVYEVPRAGGPLHGVLRDLSIDTHEVGGKRESQSVRGMVVGYGSEGSGAGEAMTVYFVDGGVLAAGQGSVGHAPVPGGRNLYVERFSGGAWGAPQFVASLSAEDAPSWAEPIETLGSGGATSLPHLTSGVSSSGRFVAFMSSEPITGYDNHDTTSGKRDEEVFLYDSSNASLTCVSCDPSGARPHGVFDPQPEEERDESALLVDDPLSWKGHWLAGSLPGWTPNVTNELSTYHPRFLSNTGRLFFNSADTLVPGDVNGRMDVYEYEPEGSGSCTSTAANQSTALVHGGAGGCVSLISSGTSADESAFLDASAAGPTGEEGADVFFTTASRLAAADRDGAFDVYDAHVCSASAPCAGGPSATATPPCAETDVCHGRATGSTNAAPFASEATIGEGNLLPAAVGRPKVLTRAQKFALALKTCRSKRPRAKRVRCEQAARRRYGPAAAKRASRHRAGTKRRGR